jgi:hypothetical protein
MNTPTITTRVADLVRNPNSAMPSKWEYSAKNKKAETASKQEIDREKQVAQDMSGAKSTTLSSGDTLTLSPLALKILEDPNPAPSNWEKARDERTQRVQQLVQEKQYILSPEIVDSIAQKIVAMLP